MNLIDVDEFVSPVLSLFSLHYFPRNDLLDRFDLEKERVILLLDAGRMGGWKRCIEGSVPTGLRQRLLAIDGRFYCEWLLEKLLALYSFWKNISLDSPRRIFLLANIRSVKLLGASKSIFNKLLHPLRVPVSHHLAIHLQLSFHALLLLLPQLEKTLLVLLAKVHHIVPYLLRRRCRGQT